MGHPRTRLVAVALAVALALVGALLGTTGAPARAAAPAPTVPVAPSALPSGKPLAAQARLVDERLLRPGKRTVPVSTPSRYQTTLHRVRGGHLVASAVYRGNGVVGYRVVVVSDAGRKRVLLRRSPYRVLRVATDGRSYVGAGYRRVNGTYREGAVLQRIRVQDGKSLGKPLTISGQPAMVAVTPARVLIAYTSLTGRNRGQVQTKWWSTRSGRTTLVASAPHPRRVPAEGQPWPTRMPENVQAASFRARAFSVIRGDRQVVLDTRTGKRLWHTAPDEAVAVFSGDGKKVLTLADTTFVNREHDSVEYTARRLTVRNARTGRVLATFKGLFEGLLTSEHIRYAVDTHWESVDAFFVRVHEALEDTEEGPFPRGTTPVRCRVSTVTCERVPATGLDGIWVTPHS